MSPELPHHHSGLEAQPPSQGSFNRTSAVGGMGRECSVSLKGPEL